MRRRLPIRDPIAAYQREAVAERRVGEDTQCICGESRAEALISGSDPVICAACDRKKRGKSTRDDHHVAGKSNSSVTIPVPVNDHRAELSPAQYDWPTETLENPNRNPVLAAAASTRGFADTNAYLTQNLLYPNAEFFEALNLFLEEKLGPKWWIGTRMEKYAPKR